MSLNSFFQPQSVAVVGVSENTAKLGSIIFQNILDSKFEKKLYAVNPRIEHQEFSGKPLKKSVADIENPVDLVVIVVPGKFVESVVDDCIANKAKNIIIISAGFRETGNRELEDQIIQKCTDNNINVLGPNCLGVIFPYANLNASFSDGYPKPGNIAFISQSGAFCTAVLDWAAKKDIGFSHFVSLGNKAGISEIDLLQNLAQDDQVKIFALYLESIKDGQKLLEIIQKIAPTKPVIILEPGESKAAQKASSSHTGALAPNAVVVKEAFRSAGAIQVFSMREMFGLLEMFEKGLQKKFGPRTAVITNAGGVGVLTSDLIESSALTLSNVSPEVLEKLKAALPAEAGLNNPIDIIGDAPADRYQAALEILTADPNVDQILVLLTPQRTTQVKETAQIIEAFTQKTDKNIIPCFIGGKTTEAGKSILQAANIPVFDFPSDAVKIMSLASKTEIKGSALSFDQKQSLNRNKDIEKIIQKAVESKFTSLPESDVRHILKQYNIDAPKSENFTDIQSAKEFANAIFPNKVVLKISSPNAVHKTELKGIFLNINTEEKFVNAWESLNKSIQISNLPNASIQIQEQITDGTETILGIHSDPNFGKFMVFGSGGIYAEVFHDTTLRILPTDDFENLISETKVGKILRGVRGQMPKNTQKLKSLFTQVGQLVQDYPEIKSIDANPVIVTEERAIAVDFKIYV